MQKKTIQKFLKIKGVGIASMIHMRSVFGLNLKKKSEFNVSYAGTLRIKKFLRIKKTASLLQTIIRKRINHHILIKSYKGVRHKNGYPVRGQRTHTNAKTQKKLAIVK